MVASIAGFAQRRIEYVLLDGRMHRQRCAYAANDLGLLGVGATVLRDAPELVEQPVYGRVVLRQQYQCVRAAKPRSRGLLHDAAPD
jgi:hypothetical protein